MGNERNRKPPLILWPFRALWRLVTFVLNVVGRLVCAMLGFALMIAGVAVALSIVGAPPGVALAAFGFLLVARALF